MNYHLVRLISFAANIFQLLIIVRAVLSWFPVNQYNEAYQLLLKLTDPILSKIRFYLDKFLPNFNLGIDISPIIALFLIGFVEKLLIRIIAI